MVNDFREKGFAEVCGVLSSERVVDLEKNLDLGFVEMEVHITTVDKATDCGLRDRSNGLFEDSPFVPIEEPNAITEDVFDILVLADRAFNLFLPISNFRKLFCKIPVLDFFNAFDREALDLRGLGHTGEDFPRAATIVRAVANDFERLISIVVFGDGVVLEVFFCNFDIGFFALSEVLFHLSTVALPRHDTKIGGIKVNVKKLVTFVRDEEFTDVRKHQSSPLGMFCKFIPEPNAFSEEEKR